jgi:hypothetical protein
MIPRRLVWWSCFFFFAFFFVLFVLFFSRVTLKFAAESLAPFGRLEFDLPENFESVFVEAKTQLQKCVRGWGVFLLIMYK